MIVSVDVCRHLYEYWYIYPLILGVTVFWVAGRFVRPKVSRRAKGMAALTRSHRIQVISLMAVALVMVLAGLQLLITYSLTEPEPVANGSSGASVYSAWTGVALVALSAIVHRYGRRRGAIGAYRLMLLDSRPPVLYLRSFGDDRLQLWTATLGRASFIERFSPSRSDTFEEVLVRHLSSRGPVIALNPPFTTLPPLGAARATLDSADWQSTVATWMDQAAQIIFVAPPERTTQGLLWEMRAIANAEYWDKTLVVVPDLVSPLALSERWQEFRPVCKTIWPLGLPFACLSARYSSVCLQEQQMDDYYGAPKVRVVI